LLSAGLADHLGLAGNFYGFALLNVLGAVLVWFTMTSPGLPLRSATASRPVLSLWFEHLANPALRASFAIGFCILFAFIGTFTYVNFVLVREPFALSAMTLGIVYLVFAPSIVTTPLAGLARDRFGTRPTFWGALAVAGIGLPLLLTDQLVLLLAGLVLVAVGTFMAQAMATAFVGRVATTDRGSASGIYLACYFLGGMVGSAALGRAFERFGWAAAVAGIALALTSAALIAIRLKPGPSV
jgi:predicted MFS family arabinose efflux permease